MDPQRFHPSPKRYFGTDKEAFAVQLDGRSETVSYDQLMRAGWGKLMEFARRAADDGGFSEGPLRRFVITYPTTAPPSVRQTIQSLLRDLEVAEVQTDYDVGVASAIFHVMREYGTYPELGLESFKARSRGRDKTGNPVQNVLVFDLGCGTTDVALFSLVLSEEAVFAPNEDRGAAGRTSSGTTDSVWANAATCAPIRGSRRSGSRRTSAAWCENRAGCAAPGPARRGGTPTRNETRSPGGTDGPAALGCAGDPRQTHEPRSNERGADAGRHEPPAARRTSSRSRRNRS